MTIDRRQLLVGTSAAALGARQPAPPDADPIAVPPARSVEARFEGTAHGFIRRLVSPGEEGERLKPFIFLDHLSGHVPRGLARPRPAADPGDRRRAEARPADLIHSMNPQRFVGAALAALVLVFQAPELSLLGRPFLHRRCAASYAAR